MANTICMYPVMAAYASQVREPDHLWGERAVPFVPSASSPANSLVTKGRQWVFALLPLSGSLDASVRYAFAQANGEVWDECLRRMEQINEELRNSMSTRYSQDRKEKMSRFREEVGPRLFTVFNVHQFFKELELEGREAPSPKALTELFDLFAKLNKGKGAQLMDIDTLFDLVTQRLIL